MNAPPASNSSSTLNPQYGSNPRKPHGCAVPSGVQQCGLSLSKPSSVLEVFVDQEQGVVLVLGGITFQGIANNFLLTPNYRGLLPRRQSCRVQGRTKSLNRTGVA